MPFSIWAPHPDDEIIGCYTMLKKYGDDTTVHFGDIHKSSCEKSAHLFGFDFCEMYHPGAVMRSGPWDVVYAPDPLYDPHPEHQWYGQAAQRLFRDGRINRLILYTTTMRAPYIHEVKHPHFKLEALDTCYYNKRSLWQSDHRYFLFEGHCEWHRLVD